MSFDSEFNRIKKEVVSKVGKANKRLTRLEKNNMENLPAYRSFMKNGGQRFSVSGKDYNQLQQELARLDYFLDSKTSLVREGNKYLKNIATKTGMGYSKVSDLSSDLSGFFEVASKIEQYLRNVEGSASAIGYQKIWEVVNKYIKSEEVEVNEVLSNFGEAQKEILKMLAFETVEESVRSLSSNWKLV